MKRVLLLALATIALGVACGGSLYAIGLEPRLEKHMWSDSTRLTLKLDPNSKVEAGKNFDVNIHITPGTGFHVYSASMSADGGLVPLTVKVPTALDSFFEIVGVKEVGEMESRFDSSFSIDVKSYSDPFDVVVTLKAKENSAAPIPFNLYVYFQTCMKSQCMPARTFAVPMTVLGEKPIDLTIAHGTVPKSHG